MGNENRLKVQLKLAVTRLKMLQQKKASLSSMQRREIALLLEKGKEESARIRVEHIIREDYTIEAMEMLELYCEMLLARFGLIEQFKTLDESIQEPVATIIYAANRVDVKELHVIKDLLSAKYGKEFAMSASNNTRNIVNVRLAEKLKVKVPDRRLVSQYLTEIAKSYNIAWTNPDSESDLIDISESFASQLDGSLDLPEVPTKISTQPGNKGSGSGSGFGSGGNQSVPASFNQPSFNNNQGMPSVPSSSFHSKPDPRSQDLFPPQPQPQLDPFISNGPPSYINSLDNPNYNRNFDEKQPLPGQSGSTSNSGNNNSSRLATGSNLMSFSQDDEPSFPSVPSNVRNENQNENDQDNDDTSDAPDFDELTRRFEALKQK